MEKLFTTALSDYEKNYGIALNTHSFCAAPEKVNYGSLGRLFI